jgi:hypothetical protein
MTTDSTEHPDGKSYGDPEKFGPALEAYVERLQEIHGVDAFDAAEILEEVAHDVKMAHLVENNRTLSEYGVGE